MLNNLQSSMKSREEYQQENIVEEEDDGNLLHAEEGREVEHKAKLSKKTKLGGFLNMGFSKPVFEGIMRIGYKTPTPIQRSAIPVIMSGQDVVAMARTGSGKTACYLLPMLEALKGHNAQTGVRALILEPTRELAEQTLRFAVKLGKFTGLHCTLVVGGDSMDEQFGALHKHPDIIIATPGRLMHVSSEMDLRLNNVQYVVFDEADRLFELGFREQLDGILSRLTGPHQRLLFSATLPKMLVDFASSGIRNPALIRLDKDDQLSQHLKLAFFSVAPLHKLHVLLYLLRFVLLETQQVIVFAATQLHVQYLECVLTKLNLPCTYLYSDMDPTSRKINAAKFQKKIVNVLVATDIAARGIDIPNLDYVINYNFPGTSKVFVHRVGRAARAGKSGVAFSLVSAEEEAYLWDLHKFLGRPVVFSPKLDQGIMGHPITIDMGSGINNNNNVNKDKSEGGDIKKDKSESLDDWNFQFGKVPLDIISEEAPQLDNLKKDCEVMYLDVKKDNAYKLYQRSRPKPSREALREMKETKQLLTPGEHPMLRESVRKCLHLANSTSNEMMERKMIMLEQLANVRPKKTIFELGVAGSKDACRRMKLKRKRDDPHIRRFTGLLNEKRAKYDQMQQFKNQSHPLQEMDEDDLYYSFGTTHRVRDDIHRVVEAKEKMETERLEQEQLKAQRELKKRQKLEVKFSGVGIKTPVAKASGEVDKPKNKRKEKKKRLKLKQLTQQVQPDTTATEIKQDYFIPHRPADADTEKGYSVHGDNFAAQSRAAQLELLQDDNSGLARQRLLQKWDSKRSKFVGPKRTEGKIKTESGKVIRSSYKTDRYESWLKRNKMDEETLEAEGGEALEEEEQLNEKNPRFQVLSTKSRGKMHPALVAEQKRLAKKGQMVREEVRNPQQVVKHLKRQKKFKEDRERGHGMKKIRMKMQGVATKPRKKKANKDGKGKKSS